MLTVASCILFVFFRAFYSIQQLLPGYITAEMKLIGCGIERNFTTDWKRFLAEVAKMDEWHFQSWTKGDPAAVEG